MYLGLEPRFAMSCVSACPLVEAHAPKVEQLVDEAADLLQFVLDFQQLFLLLLRFLCLQNLILVHQKALVNSQKGFEGSIGASAINVCTRFLVARKLDQKNGMSIKLVDLMHLLLVGHRLLLLLHLLFLFLCNLFVALLLVVDGDFVLVTVRNAIQFRHLFYI